MPRSMRTSIGHGFTSKDYILILRNTRASLQQQEGGIRLECHGLLELSQSLTDPLLVTCSSLRGGRMKTVSQIKRKAALQNITGYVEIPKTALWSPILDASKDPSCEWDLYALYLCPEDPSLEHAYVWENVVFGVPEETSDLITVDEATPIGVRVPFITGRPKFLLWGLKLKRYGSVGHMPPNVSRVRRLESRVPCDACIDWGFQDRAVAYLAPGNPVRFVRYDEDGVIVTDRLVTNTPTNVLHMDRGTDRTDLIAIGIEATAGGGFAHNSFFFSADGGFTWLGHDFGPGTDRRVTEVVYWQGEFYLGLMSGEVYRTSDGFNFELFATCPPGWHWAAYPAGAITGVQSLPMSTKIFLWLRHEVLGNQHPFYLTDSGEWIDLTTETGIVNQLNNGNNSMLVQPDHIWAGYGNFELEKTDITQPGAWILFNNGGANTYHQRGGTRHRVILMSQIRYLFEQSVFTDWRRVRKWTIAPNTSPGFFETNDENYFELIDRLNQARWVLEPYPNLRALV